MNAQDQIAELQRQLKAAQDMNDALVVMRMAEKKQAEDDAEKMRLKINEILAELGSTETLYFMLCEHNLNAVLRGIRKAKSKL